VREPLPLEVGPFGPTDPLAALVGCKQAIYLRRYLEDLGATTVLTEPYYFDRDYLAEFAAFYCISAAGYPNVCKRLHFFARALTRDDLERALANDDDAVYRLRASYLGFVVLRPIHGSPLGRTVLRWYADPQHGTPRVVAPSRDYDCHVGGLKLTVRGVAWQQQDMAVGACATIALWSMLHSSALEGHHGLPTTAAVTLSAHRTSSYGRRVFPNAGLNIQQLCEAIQGYGLSPVVVPGDVARPGAQPAFSRERFAASCAAMLRSGFPVLVLGDLAGTGHATCAIGFRSASPPVAAQGTVVHHDADIPHIYIHDDNLGPGVRFAIGVGEPGALGEPGVVTLHPEAPPRVAHTDTPDPTIGYPGFVPGHLVIAVPEDLRTSPDALHVAGLQVATKLASLFEATAKQAGRELPGFVMGSRFSRLRDYLGRDLDEVLGDKPELLGRVRLALVEQVPPMSAYVGVVRVGDGAVPLFDVLFDTTDSDAHLPVFAYVVYVASMLPALSAMLALDELPRATCVDAT
jgi:hypothetical protein